MYLTGHYMKSIGFYIDDITYARKTRHNWITLVEGKAELKFDELTCNNFFIFTAFFHLRPPYPADGLFDYFCNFNFTAFQTHIWLFMCMDLWLSYFCYRNTVITIVITCLLPLYTIPQNNYMWGNTKILTLPKTTSNKKGRHNKRQKKNQNIAYLL